MFISVSKRFFCFILAHLTSLSLKDSKNIPNLKISVISLYRNAIVHPFDVKSNFLNLDINDLRHVITPSIGYSYNINATTPTREVRISRGNSTRSSSAALELSNKLQTKRNGQSVDFVDLRIASSYAFKPKTGVKRGSSLSDFLFELKILPYSWLRI